MGKDGNKYINGAFYIIIILILVVFMIFIISKIDFNEDGENNNRDSDILEIKKIDDSREYVYDASYNLSTNVNSYMVSSDKIIYASEIVVPYINIDNNDAAMVNNEIYNLYMELVDNFNTNSALGVFYTVVEYESYINNNILSVVIYTESGGTSLPIYQYYTYNFDLVTGSLLNYDEVLNKMNLDRNNIDVTVGNILADSIHSVCDGDIEGSNQYCMTDNYTYDIFYNQSMTSYEDRINEESLKFYINNNNLYVVLNPQYPVQTSGDNRLYNVSTGEEIR